MKEAVVIRRIFQMYADGSSYKGIAKALNAEHIPPHRKCRGRTSPTWCPTAIREILKRDLCIGQIVWNRREFKKVPRTNKRVSQERPRSQWLIQEAPELRIVGQELWDLVQARLTSVSEEYTLANRPGLLHRASTSPHLLTGFIKCGVCDHNLTIVTGHSGGHLRYGCPINFNRGACSNGLKQRADEIESVLLSKLQDVVLRPESIEFAIQEFERQLQASLIGLDSRIGQMRQRAERLQSELANLSATAALCSPTPALVSDIKARQQELEDITRQLLTTEPDSISAEIGRIRQFVTRQMSDIRQLLKVDVQKGKAALEKYVTSIRMIPQLEGNKGHYVAEGEWNLLGGFDGADSERCGGWI
jgi:site-specific DNA recombinase